MLEPSYRFRFDWYAYRSEVNVVKGRDVTCSVIGWINGNSPNGNRTRFLASRGPRPSGSLLRIEKEGGQVLWNVRFRRGELSYLDFGFPSSSKPSVLANCSCGKVCLDRTTAARWGPLSPCGG